MRWYACLDMNLLCFIHLSHAHTAEMLLRTMLKRNLWWRTSGERQVEKPGKKGGMLNLLTDDGPTDRQEGWSCKTICLLQVI